MSRRQDAGRLEVIALGLLDEAAQPVGARRLAEAFRAEGIDVAEATAGRYLHRLDEVGLTHSAGKQGRVLTEAGRQRLADRRMQQEIAARSARVAAAADAHDLDALIDLLHTRRAIEAEAARLAATRATEQELLQIASAADTHVHCIETPGRIGHSHDFHLLIARASHNRMLAAMAELLLDLRNDALAQLLDRISAAAGRVLDMALDHTTLADALARRDAPEAERLMREHIDKLIGVAMQSARAPKRRAR